MDFGVVLGLDGLGPSSDSAFPASSDPDDAHSNNKRFRSGFLKQERSAPSTLHQEHDWGASKLPKTANDTTTNNNNNSASKAMLFQQQRNNNNNNNNNNNVVVRSNTTMFSADAHQQQQMLSFSCPKSEQQNAILHNYFHHPFSAYNRSSTASGYSTGVGVGGGGVLTGVRGPFTPSQWMELEHQALIYKYITANVPIPSNLLIPIRKALDSASFSAFPGSLLRPNTLGWGSFHLGFSGSTDPEPGRCRRTDGKKWRCSRDAVADQKYCERHMNRGRHRSRKPVEGQAGHAAASAAANNNNSAKLMPPAASSSPVVASNSLAIAQQQLKNLQPAASNRMYMNKEDAVDAKSKENPFLIPKQQNPFEHASRTEFGLVPLDSLLNPLNKSFGASHDRDSDDQHSLHQFMDDWPQLDMQSDRTQLSISIPMAPSGFMSSTSSPSNEKVTLSPLRLSREFDPIQMGLGVGSETSSSRQANWIPISWESSMGGPLGEVLHNTNNNSSSTMDCKNSSSALNLMTEGWDNSPRLGSSPTGVLQKTSFGSLSNSSAGSSPRAENRPHESCEFVAY